MARFIFDRVVPAAIFGSLALQALVQLIQTGPTAELQYLKLGHEILSIIFVAMLAVLFMIRRSPISQRAPLLAKIVGIVATASGPFMMAQPVTIHDWRVLALGDVLMIIGIVFTLYSLRYLGRNFGIAAEARGLVTTGVYGWVRNPVYLGEFVTIIGGMLSLVAPITILLFVVFFLLQLRRIRFEEAALSAAFPEYADYRRRTPALIPLFLTNRLALSGLPR